MAYIGPEPNPGQNREVDDISSGFNGGTASFTLQVNGQNVSPGSANAIIVSLGGVIQNPGTDYTIAASTITFTTNPASGLSFFGLVLGQQVDTEGTADASITAAKLATNSVETIKIADQAVTLAKLPHGTSSNDGKFLRANNGADPTFETVSTAIQTTTGTDNFTIADGDLVIGTAGHGISFAADGNESGATGELLDDYETGTYTAHFAIEGQSNMSMSGRVGRYTRVGNVVTVMGGGRTDGVSGQGTGNAIEFSNLPFPVFNTSSGFGHPFPVKCFNLDSSGLDSMSGSRPYIFIGRLFTDGTHGRIEGERSDSAQNSVNSSLCLSNTSELHYMFTYLTDA